MMALMSAVMAAGIVVAGLAGCRGNADLWDRYRSERMLWKAQRLAAGATADRARESRAAMALEAIPTAFPPSVWTAADAWARPMGREIARNAASAALLRARLDEDAERAAVAVTGYARVASEWGRVDSVRVLANAGRARCLERLDRDAEALDAWYALASRDVATAPGGEARGRLLEAPRRAAEWLAATGRPEAADSLRRAAALGFAAATVALGGDSTVMDVRIAGADLLDQAGDHALARNELRKALASVRSAHRRAAIWLALVRSAAAEDAPDSAGACVDAMETEISGPPARFAEQALARCWARRNVADSALAVYKRLVERSPDGADPAAEARLERASLLERQDRWEVARADLRTLATLFPSHPCGLAARVRIVRHSVEKGETELAAVEARHTLLELDDQLSRQGDPESRIRVRMARAEVMTMAGRGAEALDDLDAIWRLEGRRAMAVPAGWLAARLADSALSRPDQAHLWYTRLAEQSKDLGVRRMAREGLARETKH